jgi:hypothetical protein
MDPKSVFQLLDQEMEQAKIERSLIICGGAALITLGWIRRETRDVDVIIPDLDEELLKAAGVVATKLRLREDWLNNVVSPIKFGLPKGWEDRSVPIFEGKALTIKSLGRQDLIATKLLGACDRGDDVADLIAAAITSEELKLAKDWVLKQDGSEIWPQIVEECVSEIERQIKRSSP